MWLRKCRSVSRFKNAFNTVDNEILLNKVKRCAIQGKSFDWFESYSTNHTLISLSSPLFNVVCHRDPAIPGPLLIILYINNFPNRLSFSVRRMYANDFFITYAGSDLHLIQSSLSHDLEKLSKRLVSNILTLNATKKELILIGTRQRLSTLFDTLTLH